MYPSPHDKEPKNRLASARCHSQPLSFSVPSVQYPPAAIGSTLCEALARDDVPASPATNRGSTLYVERGANLSCFPVAPPSGDRIALKIMSILPCVAFC